MSSVASSSPSESSSCQHESIKSSKAFKSGQNSIITRPQQVEDQRVQDSLLKSPQFEDSVENHVLSRYVKIHPKPKPCPALLFRAAKRARKSSSTNPTNSTAEIAWNSTGKISKVRQSKSVLIALTFTFWFIVLNGVWDRNCTKNHKGICKRDDIQKSKSHHHAQCDVYVHVLTHFYSHFYIPFQSLHSLDFFGGQLTRCTKQFRAKYVNRIEQNTDQGSWTRCCLVWSRWGSVAVPHWMTTSCSSIFCHQNYHNQKKTRRVLVIAPSRTTVKHASTAVALISSLSTGPRRHKHKHEQTITAITCKIYNINIT